MNPDLINESEAQENTKIQVPADLKEICIHLEDSSIEHRGYLDLKTGEIIQIFDDIMDPDEIEYLDEKVDEGFGKRYITIPNAKSYEGYQEMEDFIETVNSVKLKERLYKAITKTGAFKQFKDVLNSYPKERERWFKFKDEMVMGRVNEWLEENGIEIIPQKPIEIREISPREISDSKEIEESWKGFCARGCLKCDNEEEFKERSFVISRCPDSEEEEHWLDDTLKNKFGVKNHGITAGIFNDSRGLINSAVCGKCGSQDIFFDF
jgi:DNA polymerase III alpha subunit